MSERRESERTGYIVFFAISLFSFRRLSGGSVATARRTFWFAPLIVKFVMGRGRGLGISVAFYRRWGRFSMYVSA